MHAAILTIIALTFQPAEPAVPGAEDEPYSEAEAAAEFPPPLIRRAAVTPSARPQFGAGYVPYAYPVFDSCPCEADGCFHPGWYYCGGKPYRRAWLGRWLDAHLGRSSMLDAYPCHCVFPTFGRARSGLPGRSSRAEQLPSIRGVHDP